MKRILKIVLKVVLGLVVMLIVAAGTFIYKARYGINFYDSTLPDVLTDLSEKTVLLFTKTTGFWY